MKSCLKIIACLTAVAVLFCSCSKMVRSHQTFMNNLKTKADVTHYFGYPSQYQELGETSRWLYDLRKQKRTSQRNPNPIKTDHEFEEAKKVQEFDYFDKYLEVTFKNDSVVNSNTVGVKYTLRKPQPLKTVLFVVGILGIGIGLMALFYEPINGPVFIGF